MGSQGKSVEFSFSAQKRAEKQWIRQDKTSRFRLISEKAQPTEYLILELYSTGLSVYDKTGSLLFSRKISLSPQTEFQYYVFRGQKDLLILTDPNTQRTRFLDLSGEDVLPSLSSAHKVALIYQQSSQSFLIHKVLGNEYVILSYSLSP